ncbi:hypothetical protein CRG98_021431 [Punica granatum]|uniref:Uncharacterized protein n=1 Tax=Punica granatum TaxID=22663 RepID=A0A2I0JQI7_PUNGR|nr:hypothetical protein CRG98_021431 [Punica granatum]
MRATKCNAAWECLPSRGRATDAREKESPLAILRPEDRIGPDRPKEKPPKRTLGRTGEVGPGWAWAGTAKKNELGRGPLAEGRPGSGGSGDNEDGGGGSRPWMPLRRPEWTREIALGAADASPWSIGTSPALNQSESGELSWFSGDGSEFN